MLKNKWILLVFIVIIVLLSELIFFFIKVNSKSLNKNITIHPTITKGGVINTVISGNISTIELGTISIPLSSDTGEIIITGILKNVYENNNKIYADILFQDSAGNTRETNNIVIIPNNQIPFTLEKLPTPQFIDPNHKNAKYQTITFSQAINTLKLYINKTLIFYFNTIIPNNLNIFPSNTRKHMKETNPYYKCNQTFLKNLQNHNFVFPNCNLYTNIGGIYVEKNK